jgi:hypothetical protein
VDEAVSRRDRRLTGRSRVSSSRLLGCDHRYRRTAAAPQRNERADELKAYRELDAFRNRPTIRLVRRLVAGPYVVDLQSRGRDSVLRLDIFEVRNAKIVREWESGGLPSRP